MNAQSHWLFSRQGANASSRGQFPAGFAFCSCPACQTLGASSTYYER